MRAAWPGIGFEASRSSPIRRRSRPPRRSRSRRACTWARSTPRTSPSSSSRARSKPDGTLESGSGASASSRPGATARSASSSSRTASPRATASATPCGVRPGTRGPRPPERDRDDACGGARQPRGEALRSVRLLESWTHPLSDDVPTRAPPASSSIPTSLPGPLRHRRPRVLGRSLPRLGGGRRPDALAGPARSGRPAGAARRTRARRRLRETRC